MTRKTQVIIIRETIWESMISDGFTFLMVLALVGVGIMVNSIALQFIGVIIALFLGLTMFMSQDDKMTIEQARAKLDEIERGL